MRERLSSVRALPWLFSAAVVVSCSLDERTLEPKPTPGVGGVNGVGGTSSGKSGTGGAAHGGSGQSGNHTGGSGGTGSPDGGETSDGGDANQGGNAGTTGVGGSMAGSGNMAGSGGSGANGGSGGSAGAMDIGNCADLNENHVRDCEETLVQNSTFNSDVSSWAASAGATQEWDALDARDRSGSGSIKVTNNNHASGTGMTAVAAEQCIPVEGGKTYDIRARVFVDEDESPGTPDLILWFYDTEDCSGEIRWTRLSGMLVERGAWQVIASLAAAPISPVPARSVRIRLAAVKAFNAADFKVYFDDVLAKAVEAE